MKPNSGKYRLNLTLSTELKNEMQKYKKILNWSQIARNAFVEAMNDQKNHGNYISWKEERVNILARLRSLEAKLK